MSDIAARIQAMEESATIAMARKSREMAAQGVEVISLSLGEPDFSTPDFIKDAAVQAIEQNYSSYTPIGGYVELKEAIAEKLERDNQLSFDPSQIVCSTGAKQSIWNIAMALVDPGDEVILPVPYWVSYREMVRMAEGIPRYIQTTVEQGYKFTAQQLEDCISERSRLLIFSNPCNPSGAVYDESELREIAAVIEKHPDLYVVSDEIYELIRFEGTHFSLGRIDAIKERVITVNGLSKGFAMTGWRLGYMAAAKEVAQACEKLQGQVTSAPNCIAQRAAITALKAVPSEVAYMKDSFRKRRDLVLEKCKDIPGWVNHIPGGAFYLFPDVRAWFGQRVAGREIKDASDLCMLLLEEAHVGLVPGGAFGSPNSLRISYAASEEQLVQAMDRIKKVLAG
jgi:aspartate aminotransferase